MTAPALLNPAVPFQFRLDLHDGDTPAADPPPPEAPAPDPPADPPPAEDDGDGRGSKKAVLDDLAKERARRQTAETARKAAEKLAEDQARRLAEFEDRDKTAQEKAEADAQRAKDRAATLEKRAVAAEIRAAAIQAGFADPTDAVDALAGTPSQFLRDGDVDPDAITTALGDLLERKPHWRKPEQAPPPKPAPKPDPSQGGDRPPAPPADYMKASPEEFAAEQARLGIRTYR